MEKKSRRKFSSAFKSKVALEAAKGLKTIMRLHPVTDCNRLKYRNGNELYWKICQKYLKKRIIQRKRSLRRKRKIC